MAWDSSIPWPSSWVAADCRFPIFDFRLEQGSAALPDQSAIANLKSKMTAGYRSGAGTGRQIIAVGKAAPVECEGRTLLRKLPAMIVPRLRSPIVLVHGLLGFGRLWIWGWPVFGYFPGIPESLRAAGNRVLVPQL